MNGQQYKRRPNKKKRLTVLCIVLIALFAVLLAIVAGAVTFLRTYRPSLDTNGPPFVDGHDDSANTGDDEQSGDVYIRDTESVNFLVAGRDKDAWNTDVMMLVNFNMREGSVNVLQIPRDTYVETDGVRGRLNTMMKTKRQEAYNKDKSLSSEALMREGMKGLVESLEKNLCVQIDGYAIVNLEGFRNIINVIGGVYMDVPFDMVYHDPYQDLNIELPKGPRVLSGAEAEMFVRFRSGFVQGDIGRVNAQKIFLTALFKQLKNNLTVTTVPALAEQLFKYVVTDVSFADAVIYAKELLSVNMENISMVTLPGSDARSSSTGAWYYIMHRADTLTVINEYFNVYDKPVTDEMFDTTHAFTDEDYSVFADIYFAEPTDIKVEHADDIDSSGIVIPMN